MDRIARTVTAPEFDRDAPAHKDILIDRLDALALFMPKPVEPVYVPRHAAK